MVWRILRSRGVIPLALILAAFAYWKLHPQPPQVINVGYVADRNVTLWNTLAQVKQPIAELHYGDRVEVMREEGIAAQVRTTSNILGWMLDSNQIMDSDLWGRSAAMLTRARTLPAQALGHTKAVSNVRIGPGRNAKRIFQFVRDTPVIVLERAVADAPQTGDENSQDERNSAEPSQKPRQEDWLLILRAGEPLSENDRSEAADYSTKPIANRASAGPVSSGPQSQSNEAVPLDGGSQASPVAGWVLARFIELDLPGPVRDYASSADLHVVAWFVLNRVPDGSGGEAPQYLVAGSRGGEGQPCDFTMLRVYTWGVARMRYETAYVESDVCGRLPIRISQGAKGPEFQFADAGDTSSERTYVMQQTMVRLVKDPASPHTSHRN